MIHSDAGAPPRTFDDPAQIADAIVEKVGKKIVLALPLGLGKANHIANALYAKAAADPSIRLTIFTALTLTAPRAKSELERRFLDPIAKRCLPAIRRSTTPPQCAPARFRPTSRSTSSSSRPASGSLRLMRSSNTSRPTTRMPCTTCSIAASMWSASWWRTAPTNPHGRTA